MELDALSGLSLVGVIFLFYFIRKTLYTDVGAFFKISVVNISCTNK